MRVSFSLRQLSPVKFPSNPSNQEVPLASCCYFVTRMALLKGVLQSYTACTTSDDSMTRSTASTHHPAVCGPIWSITFWSNPFNILCSQWCEHVAAMSPSDSKRATLHVGLLQTGLLVAGCRVSSVSSPRTPRLGARRFSRISSSLGGRIRACRHAPANPGHMFRTRRGMY